MGGGPRSGTTGSAASNHNPKGPGSRSIKWHAARNGLQLLCFNLLCGKWGTYSPAPVRPNHKVVWPEGWPKGPARTTSKTQINQCCTLCVCSLYPIIACAGLPKDEVVYPEVSFGGFWGVVKSACNRCTRAMTA